MNIQDAAYQTVHDYQGGSESLAPRIGMSPAILRNKVNPNNTTHHLTLREASALMGVTNDFRILHGLAAEHDHVAQKCCADDAGSILSAMLVAAAAKGSLASTLSEAMADLKITTNEAALIAKHCAAVQEAMSEIASRARTKAKVGGSQK